VAVSNELPGDLTPTGRVPAEHRFLGLDRRTFLPGLIVIGLYLFWTVLIPAVNEALEYEQTTAAGDVFLISEGLTMEAQEGWGVESGLLSTEKTSSNSKGEPVLLVNGGVSFSVATGPYSGEGLRPLLNGIKKVRTAAVGDEAFHVVGKVQGFTTSEGQRGLGQAYSTVEGMGVVAALQYEETGLSITATGPVNQMSDKADEIEAMIDSIAFEPKAGGE
jgi:hypothetical protein